jgi:hypothetical protein
MVGYSGIFMRIHKYFQLRIFVKILDFFGSKNIGFSRDFPFGESVASSQDTGQHYQMTLHLYEKRYKNYIRTNTT